MSVLLPNEYEADRATVIQAYAMVIVAIFAAGFILGWYIGESNVLDALPLCKEVLI